MNEITPGWKTTEFWGTHMTQIITFVATLFALFHLQLSAQQQTALVGLGGSIIGMVQAFYTKGRTDVKIAQLENQFAPEEQPK